MQICIKTSGIGVKCYKLGKVIAKKKRVLENKNPLSTPSYICNADIYGLRKTKKQKDQTANSSLKGTSPEI